MREHEDGLIASSEAPHWLARIGDRVAWYSTLVGLERWARLVAVAMIPILMPAGGLTTHGPAFAATAGYVLVTALARRNRYLRSADLIVAAAIVAAMGVDATPFLPFLLVTVAGPASQGGLRAGVAAGCTLTVVLLAQVAFSGTLDQVGTAGVLPLALLMPLVGITTAAATEVLGDRSVRGRLVLQEANRLLSSLRDIADDIPGGLDTATVAAAIVAELRSIPGATGAMVYVEDGGVLRPCAATGIGQAELPTLRVDELRLMATAAGRLWTPHALPTPLRTPSEAHLHWMSSPITREGSLTGLLLVGFDELEPARAARSRLLSLATDSAIALENAQLFDGTRTRAAEAARRRVAGDLHDGVAQSLAHLRMELELLARTGDDPEIAGLARVAGSALTDLRNTIAGLRRPIDGDLAELLRRHLDDVRTGRGPDLALDLVGDAELSAERTEEAFLVAQEAISNALRHARATTVTVALERDDDVVLLAVEDDGVGRSVPSDRAGGGVGLASMQERATRLDGQLEIRDRRGGGTLLVLRFPTRSASNLTGRTP